MLIEVMVRWPEMKPVNNDSEDAKLKRLLSDDDEDRGQQVQITYSYSPMILDEADIRRWNKTPDKGFTTIRLSDGDRFVIKMDYDMFTHFISELRGVVIESITPDNVQIIDTASSTDIGDDEDMDEDDIDL